MALGKKPSDMTDRQLDAGRIEIVFAQACELRDWIAEINEMSPERYQRFVTFLDDWNELTEEVGKRMGMETIEIYTSGNDNRQIH